MTLSLVGLFSAVVLIGAVSADEFEMSRYTIDGGGVMFSTGGDFELSATIGQPDAGTMTGGGFQLFGGFWFPVVAGDGNGDGVVDLVDYGAFESCFEGPGGAPPEGECSFFDTDGNGTVDLSDFAAVQTTFTGP